MINSNARRAKWTDQTAPSSEQTANWSIETASSKVKTTLSSCRSAWSRSRRRRGRRPHEVFGFASNIFIIDGELRKTFGQFSTLKRASRSLAKTGLFLVFFCDSFGVGFLFTLLGALEGPLGAIGSIWEPCRDDS